MSRIIKFRGLDKNGIWRFGYYHAVHEAIQTYHYIRESSSDKRIDPVTLGQWTGLKDKTGKEIYEGDIVRLTYKHKCINQENCTTEDFIVTYESDKARFMLFDKTAWWSIDNTNIIEVIGNIYQNPELLSSNNS